MIKEDKPLRCRRLRIRHRQYQSDLIHTNVLKTPHTPDTDVPRIDVHMHAARRTQHTALLPIHQRLNVNDAVNKQQVNGYKHHLRVVGLITCGTIKGRGTVSICNSTVLLRDGTGRSDA